MLVVKLLLEIEAMIAKAINNVNPIINRVSAVVLYLSPELLRNLLRCLSIQIKEKQGAIIKNIQAENIDRIIKSPALGYLALILSTLIAPFSSTSSLYFTGLLLRVELRNLPPNASNPNGT
eukprot:NODE_148_length_17471_cov_0.413136.p14 type:complete len:121 gc:universal NODE_148_length_17471_cov_0.413136:8629-8991(+)